MPRLVTAALVAAGTTATAGHADAAADPPVYFVHGYAPDGGSDCDKIWPYAVDHFTKQSPTRWAA